MYTKPFKIKFFMDASYYGCRLYLDVKSISLDSFMTFDDEDELTYVRAGLFAPPLPIL